MEITQRQIEPSFISEDWFISMPADYQHLYMLILLSCDNTSGIWRPKRAIVQMYLRKMVMFDTFLDHVNKDDNGSPCRRILVTEKGNWLLLPQMKATIGPKFSGSGPKISLLKKIVANELFPKDFPEFDWSGLENLDNEHIKNLLLHNPKDSVTEQLRNLKGSVGLRYNIPTNINDPDNTEIESKSIEESKHSKGEDSKGEGEMKKTAPVVKIPVASVWKSTSECQVRVSKQLQNGLKMSVQDLYDTDWGRYINLHPSMDMAVREEDFNQWKAFVDMLVDNDMHDVFKVEWFICPADFRKLVKDGGFTENLWQPVMRKMIGTGIKPENNLYMRIPDYIGYLKPAKSKKQNETVASTGPVKYADQSQTGWAGRANRVL